MARDNGIDPQEKEYIRSRMWIYVDERKTLDENRINRKTEGLFASGTIRNNNKTTTATTSNNNDNTN